MSAYSTWEDPFRPLSPMIARVAEAWFDVEGIEAEGGYPVGLLVGEQPGLSSNPKLPLWPYPPRSAGGRLHTMSGIPVRDYLLRLARVNLARRPVAKWDTHAADLRLAAILERVPDAGRVVLCGARARNAWCPPAPGREWFHLFATVRGIQVVAIPHPSGRSREYGDPATVARAQEAVRWAAGWETGS